MSDGTRTRDHLDHNQELYQLSYAHREGMESSADPTSSPPQSDQRRMEQADQGLHVRVDRRTLTDVFNRYYL